MSYGWGIGHPNHPVADMIELLVDGEYEIWDCNTRTFIHDSGATSG